MAAPYSTEGWSIYEHSEQYTYFLGKKGAALMSEAVLNLAEAFTCEERAANGLRGLIPPRVQPLALQATRYLALFNAEPDPLKRFLMLSELFDINVNLFYKIVVDHFADIAPFIYTPHVGQYCLKLHEVWRPKSGSSFVFPRNSVIFAMAFFF